MNVLTDASGAIVQETSYDAWSLSDHWRSNRRDPATLQNYATPPTNLITDRGFTGHSLSDCRRKHMDAFKLINMNGRIYDPALGRFLSPDNYVQSPNFTQSYNRYSYCMNNPLMYADPSGMYRLPLDKQHTGGGGDSNSYPFITSNGFNSDGTVSHIYSPTSGSEGYGTVWGDDGSVSYIDNATGNAASYDEVYNNYVVKYGSNRTSAFNDLVNTFQSMSFSISAFRTKEGLTFVATDKVRLGNGGVFDYVKFNTSEGGYVFDSPESDVIEVIGDVSSLYGSYKEAKNAAEYAYRKNLLLPYKQNINTGTTTWIKPKYVKYAKWAGYLGTAGDVISLAGSLYNIAQGGYTIENVADLISSGIGFIPIYGDVYGLFYMMAKDKLNTVKNCSDIEMQIRMDEAATMACCFVEGTKVLMGDGSYKNIELVQITDTVLTYDFTEKRIEKKSVVRIDTPIHYKFVKVIFSNGIEVISTEDHPYYVKGKGWSSFNPELTFKNYGIKTSQIETSDVCLTFKRNRLKKVKAVLIIPFEKSIKTYNLTKIANSNNYFVNGILVNNEEIK